MSEYKKPLPELDGLTAEFYGWCKKGELRFQRCLSCNGWRHVPREMCPECASTDWEWQRSSGKGKIFTWTVAERPMHPGFADAAPYAPVVVELEEGVRVLTEMTDCMPSDLVIDMPVEVTFEAVTPEVTLPKFKKS